MARAATLTDAKIAKLKPEEKRYTVPDGQVPGLYVRVMPSGSKSFTIVARDPYGKQIWREVEGTTVGIDALDDVREKARAGIKRIKAGQDAFPPPKPKAETFRAVAADWIKRHVEAKGLRSQHEIERLLRQHVYEPWGEREFTAIRRGDVAKLLDHVQDNSGARQADYVLAIVRGIANWYEGRNEGYDSPIVRNMARRKASEQARKRVLTDDEIRVIWPHLQGTFGNLVKLALLTGQRREKLVTMKWTDISEDGVWTIPSEQREKGHGASLPLPGLALEIVRSQPRVDGNEYVFAGRAKEHFVGYSPCKRVLDAKLTKAGANLERWTLHDCRRTAKTLMMRAGVDRFHAERVLGHVIAGVEGVYDRHSYVAEKGAALAALASLLDRILNPPGANVVPLRATA